MTLFSLATTEKTTNFSSSPSSQQQQKRCDEYSKLFFFFQMISILLVVVFSCNNGRRCKTLQNTSIYSLISTIFLHLSKMKVTNTNSSRSVSSSTIKNDVSNSYNKMSMRRYHSLREVIGIHYTPININTFRGLRRILLVAFVLILGLFSIHLAVVQRGGMNEVELLNELMEKSRLAYANSVLYSRQNSSRNPNSRPGHVLKTQGATAKYPVILIPGFITSGLELWSGEECAKTYFRQRLWGSLPVFMQTFFTDNECWRRHLSLDPETGMQKNPLFTFD